MQYRDVDILATKTVGDSGTETVDLDVTDPITELSVVVELTNGAAKAKDVPPTNIVSKIELVDGGTVYASLNGPEAAACFFYDTGRYPPHWYDETLSGGQNVTLPIRFGRFLGDPLRNFDPTKLRNPQLKVTWSKNALHLTGYVKLGVRAKLLDGVAGASSCLLTKSARAFTTAGSGIESTELPTDYPIRRLYVRVWLAEPCPANMLSHWKLDCDEGKFIALDMGGWAMQDLVEQSFGYARIRQFITATNGDKKQTWLGSSLAGSAATAAPGYSVQMWCSGNSYAVVYGCHNDGTSMDEKKVETNIYGSLPHNTFAIPFGLPEDPSTWFNVGAYRKVKLNLTQGESGADCEILAQQDRPL